VRGYISCAAGCPYEGEVKPQAVAALAEKLHEMGCYEISLGDTIGVGTPRRIRAMIEAVARKVPTDKLGGHYHDTTDSAREIYASLEAGRENLRQLGGGPRRLPLRQGRYGQRRDRDVVYMLDGLGIETGVRPDEGPEDRPVHLQRARRERLQSSAGRSRRRLMSPDTRPPATFPPVQQRVPNESDTVCAKAAFARSTRSAAWSALSDAEKRAVLARLPARRTPR